MVKIGDRGQILIKDSGIYLYTHWEGYNLKQTLQKALQLKWRWDDFEYLTRIIFEVMIGEDTGTETGFGIGTIIHADLNNPLLTVDVKNRKVIEEELLKEWTFEEFIELDFEEED